MNEPRTSTVAPPDRDAMHQFIDRVPDAELSRMGRVMAALTDDPVLRSLLTAPYDDEPYTDEQRARVDEARRGPSIAWDEAMRLIEK